MYNVESPEWTAALPELESLDEMRLEIQEEE
jgi:hypothetical protein